MSRHIVPCGVARACAGALALEDLDPLGLSTLIAQLLQLLGTSSIAATGLAAMHAHMHAVLAVLFSTS